MGVSYNPKIVTDGLVLCLDAANRRSYPGTGTTWTDLSGNGNNGTLTNGPIFDSANGGSIVFDGTNDYVRVPSNNYLYFAGKSNVTTSCWTKINYQNSTLNSFIMWEDVVGGNSREAIRLLSTPSDNYLPKFGIYRSPGGDINANTAVGTTQMNTSTYYNITGTYDGIDIKIYLNGILEGAVNWPGVIATPLSGTSVRWIIGAGELVDPRYLNGKIAQASIYNRALSANEVQQNFNATRGRYGI